MSAFEGEADKRGPGHQCRFVTQGGLDYVAEDSGQAVRRFQRTRLVNGVLPFGSR